MTDRPQQGPLTDTCPSKRYTKDNVCGPSLRISKNAVCYNELESYSNPRCEYAGERHGPHGPLVDYVYDLSVHTWDDHVRTLRELLK
ncbi:hypothetical protein PoB_007187900 [Plakobranchus ocellatus]|uniref:Uncharacterized protein n=1 Tax=Plakobranchus ocellatus TaxID=259542 RepID=A0AAV4DN18_9GAST|nr:hypothetical protein PoB_007187900 [Plakobranchus ocellatus]